MCMVCWFQGAREPNKNRTNLDRPKRACLAIRGCYVQKNGAGMLIDVTHLQYAQEAEDDVAPF